MVPSIVEKLKAHLAQPINNEPAVVYLLCQTRKLLEQDPQRPDLFALRMYCNWALHVSLDKRGTTRVFLEQVDLLVQRNVSGYHPTAQLPLLNEWQLFKNFVFLDTFRKELTSYLAGNDIPTDILDDDKHWFDFLSAYAGVIDDGELTIGNQRNDLVAVDRVVFGKGSAPRLADPHLPFLMNWRIHLKDRRVLNAEFASTSYKNIHSSFTLV